jgi:hypothetical protein
MARPVARGARRKAPITSDADFVGTMILLSKSLSLGAFTDRGKHLQPRSATFCTTQRIFLDRARRSSLLSIRGPKLARSLLDNKPA